MKDKVHKPRWFKDGEILIINSPTCGINKDGITQYKVDVNTGERSNTEIDDKLYEAVVNVSSEKYEKEYISLKDEKNVLNSKVLVPQYHDEASLIKLKRLFNDNSDFKIMSLRELVDTNKIFIGSGHGSPSSDQRVGDIPYIKVSDIRAGQININPTNKIPTQLANKFWKGEDSGLKAYDLISPERASKNIGEFSVLMPGQEKIVLTKEVIIIRSLVKEIEFDQFYLLWALSLDLVREQWKRIVLMQTNREDVGSRLYEIQIPIPINKSKADEVSKYFKDYYDAISKARTTLDENLKNDRFKHHFYLSSE